MIKKSYKYGLTELTFDHRLEASEFSFGPVNSEPDKAGGLVVGLEASEFSFGPVNSEPDKAGGLVLGFFKFNIIIIQEWNTNSLYNTVRTINWKFFRTTPMILTRGLETCNFTTFYKDFTYWKFDLGAPLLTTSAGPFHTTIFPVGTLGNNGWPFYTWVALPLIYPGKWASYSQPRSGVGTSGKTP